jgi:YD repeat-containing protein
VAAIVSGGGLGILQGSAGVLGSAGQLGAAVQGRAGERVYLNAATGNLVIQGQDEVLIGRGPDGAFLRTYNSQGLLNDDNGDNWRLNFHRRVIGLSTDATVTRVDADGAEAVYTYDAALGKYVTSEGSGAFDTLSHSGSTWTWTDGDTGVSETYDAANGGRLSAVIDESGNSITFSYNGAGLLSAVQTASGETTYLDYAGTNLTQIRTVASGGATLVRTSYAYDADNRLTSVITDLTPESTTDSKTYVTSYTYDGTSRRVATMTQSDGTSLAFAYDGSARVTTITQNVAGEAARVTTVAYSAGSTTVTDPLGRSTVLAYDGSSRLTGITLPAVGGVSQQVSYAYDAAGNVTSVTDARGNAVVYGYDANGNRIHEHDAAGNAIDRVYGSKNELLAETRSGATTRYVYDSSTRLRFVVSAAGRVSEHLYNGFGQRVTSIEYSAALYNVSGLAPTATLTEAQLSAWVPAGSANTIRTDTAYDFRGQVASVTTDGAVTQFVYDQAGKLLQTVDPRGTATAQAGDFQTSYAYDGMGRVLSSTDALGRITLTDYQDADRKTVITLANGLVRTSTYSAAGELISLLESADSATLGETKYFYDANGRLKRTEDQTGVKRHVLYDEAGRKVAEVDGDGSLTEYRYDASNNLTRTIQYASAVSAAITDTSTLAAIRPAAHADDRSTWHAYDAANRLVKSVDAEGSVTQRFYDGAGRLIQQVQFASAIATDALGDTPAAGAITPASSSAERLTRAFHDAQGKVLAALDGAGYLVENKYDAAGQLVETVAYATATNPALRATGTLDQLRPAAAVGDARTYSLYNARGQRAGVVDAEGYLTETVYDAAGNTTQVIRYATKVTYSAGATLASLRPASTAQDEVCTYTYDALNRVTSKTAADGAVTQSTYDAAGNLAKTVQAVGTGDVRTLNAQYDKQGRLTAELSGVGSALLTGGQTQAEIDAIWNAHAVKHTYDAAGRRSSTTDALGNRTLFYYDADGRLEYTIGATGEVRRSAYNTLGQVAQTVVYGTRLSGSTLATLAGGRIDSTLSNAISGIASSALDSSTSYLYYRSGVLAQTIDALGNVTSQTYNAFHEATGTEQPNGVSSAKTYDANGRVTSAIVDPGGLNLKTTFVYDALGRTVTLTEGADSANPRVTQYQYDRLGRLTAETVDPGSAPKLNLVTSYAYDKNGNVTQKTDARGFVTRYFYDAADRLVYSLDALNGVTRTIYDSLGRVAQTIAYANAVSVPANPTLAQLQAALQPAAGRDAVTTSVYDKDGREIYSVDGLNGVTKSIRDKNGNVVERIVYATKLPAGTALNATAIAAAQATNALDRSTRTTYDAQNRPVYTIDATGAVTQTVYDEKGNVARTVRYANAVANLPVVPSSAADRVEQRFYDKANRLVYVVDALGYAKETRYDAASRISATVQYGAAITLDSTPTTVEVTAALAALPANTPHQTNSFVYDAGDRLVSSTDAEGFSESFTYDAVGNKLSFTNKKGATWDYAYDANRRLIRETSPEVPVTSVNPNTLVATSTNVRIETRIAYDRLGNVLSRTEAHGLPEARTTSYEYDALGRQVRTNFPLVGVYNAAGDNLATNGIDGTVARSETQQTPYSQVTYDALGNAVVNRDAGGNYSYKVYDVLGRVRYEIDAERYLSEHKYNALGDEIELARFATALSFAAHPNAAAPFTETEVAGIAVASAQDRKLVTTYDKLGRATRVDEPTAFNFDPTATTAANQTFDAGRITKNTYNAFGQLVLQSTLRNADTNEWIDTYSYFDRRGNKVAQVDALGYLTKWEYDETGDVVREVQYAAALAGGSWSLAGHPANPATTTPLNSPASAIGYDRETAFVYDRRNQRIAATRVNAEYSEVSGALGLSTEVANLTTTYGYDALGNQVRVTDPNGASSYTYYDVLGRVSAVAETPRIAESTTAAVIMPPLRVSYSASTNTVSLRFAVQTSSGTAVGFRYAKAGTTNWSAVLTPSVSGTDYLVSPNGLTSDRYVYEITYTKAGESSPYATGSGSFNVLGPTSAGATHVAATVEKPSLGGSVAATAHFQQIPGDEGGYTLQWSGQNQIELSWSSLNALGNGDVRVRVNYRTYSYEITGNDGEGGYTYGVTNNGVNTHRQITYSASQAQSGVTMSWSEAQPFTATNFGVQQINSIQVWKVVGGQEIQVYSAAPGTAFNERLLLRGNTAGLTGISVAGVGTLAASALGAGVYAVDLGSLSRRTYQFTPIGTASAVGGEFTVTKTTVAGPAGVQETSSTLNAYNLPAAAKTVVMQYRLVGDTGPYLSKQLGETSTAGSFTTPYDDVANGNYEFILTVRNASGVLVNLAGVGGTAAGTLSGTFKVLRGGQSLPSVVRHNSALEVTPLTTMAHDAHGNVVRTTRHAKGTSGADADGYGVPTAAAGDQASTSFFDSHGHTVRTVDAEGAAKYTSYDAMGRAVKEWQPVTNNDGLVNHAVRVFQYDKLGRQTATIEPSYQPNSLLATSSIDDQTRQSQSVTWSIAQVGQDGGESGWTPNLVNVNWNDLSAWGTGAVTVRVYYRPRVITGGDSESGYTYGPGAETHRNFNFGGAVTGAQQVQWSGDSIWDVRRAIVWKDDASGTAVKVHDRTASGAYGNRFHFSVPQQPGTVVTFLYKLTSASQWTEGTLWNMGTKYVANTVGLANGTYHYEIQYRRPGETNPSSASRGSFVLNGTSGSVTTTGTATEWTPVALNPASYARSQAQYNAFGEVVRKGLNDGWQEYYHYDNAGRLWRTNKDGVATVYLYDAQGNSTAQIRSQTHDLASYATLADVLALAGSNVQRTNTHYDELGRVVKQVEPSFSVVRSLDPIPFALGMPQLSLNFNVAQQGFDGGESGWVPNLVNVSWNEMTSWGSGNVTIRVYYTPRVVTGGDSESGYTYGPGALTHRDFTISSANSTQLSWTGDTVWSVTRVRVQKRDADNALVTIHDQTSSGASGRALVWQTPTLAGNQAVIKYRPTAGGSWVTVAAENFGTRYFVDARGLSGSYDYEILYTRPNESAPYAHKTGVFTVGNGNVTDTTAQSTVVETLTPTTQQTLDRWGNVLTLTDARGGDTTHRYNFLDQLVEQKQPLVRVWAADGSSANARPVQRNYFDALGRAIGTRDANGNVNTARYDAAGQLIAEYHPDGGVVAHNYDVLGRRIRTVDAVGNATDYTYDRLDRVTKEKRPIGDDEYTYDELGNRTSSTNALNKTTLYWYDTRGKMIRSKLPGGQETNYYYDLRGNKVKEVNANNHYMTWTYSGVDGYFGRASAHRDLGAGIFGYSYDFGGQLKLQTNSRATSGQDQVFTYYENGRLKQVTDQAVNTHTFYEYDVMGNRVREKFSKGSTVHLDNRITFDAHGRITEVKDNRYTITYGYDANGNRRKAVSDYFDNDDVPQHVENWYKYDAMNRITLSQGVLSSNDVIVITANQGVELLYDAAGNRVMARTKIAGGAFVEESYEYDDNNRLVRTFKGGSNTSLRAYDAAGRVIETTSYNANGTVKERRENTYNANNWMTRVDVFNGSGTHLQRTSYTGYDALGNVTGYQVQIKTGTTYTNTYKYTYARYDSYKESKVEGSSTYFQDGDTTTTYDVNGNIVSVVDQFDETHNRSFIADASGKILRKTEDGKTQHYFYVNDKPIGSSGALSAADFDYNYTPVSAQYPASAPGKYMVSQGDTLQSIALAVFGDAQLWYVIADANGLRTNADLETGQQLTIPNRITNLHNNAQTFKVYAPGAIIGDTTPTLPDPPPPPQRSGGGCGGIGAILVIIVAVVVTVFTAGAALAVIAPAATTAGMTVWGAGMAALAGQAGVAGIAAAAIGGAVGSIASQAVGIGIGVQDKFSWGAVASSALTSAFSAGVGSLGAGGIAGKLGVENAVGQMMVNGAIGNAVNQGINIVTGQQEKFDWRGVAAAAISAPIASAVGGAAGKAFEGMGSLVSQTASGIASGLVRSAISRMVYGGGRIDIAKIATDAFGNALGNAMTQAFDRAGWMRLPELAPVRAQAALPPMMARAALGAQASALSVLDALDLEDAELGAAMRAALLRNYRITDNDATIQNVQRILEQSLRALGHLKAGESLDLGEELKIGSSITGETDIQLAWSSKEIVVLGLQIAENVHGRAIVGTVGSEFSTDAFRLVSGTVQQAIDAPGLQEARFGFMHSMTPSAEQADLFKTYRAQWVDYHQQMAHAAMSRGDTEAALIHFGLAVHTVQDATSPQHGTTGRDLKVWEGNESKFELLQHVSKELRHSYAPNSFLMQGTAHVYWDFFKPIGSPTISPTSNVFQWLRPDPEQSMWPTRKRAPLPYNVG